MILPFVFLFLTPRLHAAIELSLESNRVERGNIGYVDMEKLFEKFPETIAAKKKFKKDLQKAEDKINLEKIGILHLRQDLSDLRMERKYDLTNQSKPKDAGVSVSSSASHRALAISSSPAAATPVSSAVISTKTVISAPASVASSSKTSTATPLDKNLISALPGFGPTSMSSSTSSAYAVSAGSSVVKTPGEVSVSSAAVSRTPPAVSTSNAKILVSSSPVKTPVALPSNPAFAIASTHQKPVSPSKMTLPQLNDKIDKENREITRDEAALKQDESSIEKNLLNLENRETQGLLGKIYKVIREVATESGVSVVVDKSQILYGHNAVDLTDKVLKRLKVLKASGGFQ